MAHHGIVCWNSLKGHTQTFLSLSFSFQVSIKKVTSDNIYKPFVLRFVWVCLKWIYYGHIKDHNVLKLKFFFVLIFVFVFTYWVRIKGSIIGCPDKQQQQHSAIHICLRMLSINQLVSTTLDSCMDGDV